MNFLYTFLSALIIMKFESSNDKFHKSLCAKMGKLGHSNMWVYKTEPKSYTLLGTICCVHVLSICRYKKGANCGNDSLKTLHHPDISTVATQRVVPRLSRITGERASQIISNMELSGSATCEEVPSFVGRNEAPHLEIIRQISRKAGFLEGEADSRSR